MAKVHDARIRANLERHAKIMNKLIIQGLSRIEASAEALRIMEQDRLKDDEKVATQQIKGMTR